MYTDQASTELSHIVDRSGLLFLYLQKELVRKNNIFFKLFNKVQAMIWQSTYHI